MCRRLLSKLTMLAAVCSIAGSTGCGIYNPRHGMILRGDWSLEMNRVPWLNSRTQSYDEVGHGSCAPGMVVEPPTAAESCAASGAYPAQPLAHHCPAPPLVCRTCQPHAAMAGNPPPQQMAHSRFHPVPTRPVFTPWNCSSSDSGTAQPVPTQATPTQPAPELIPTPAGSQSTRQSTRAESSVKNAAWIFQPEKTSGHTIAAN